MIGVGDSDDERRVASNAIRKQLAFYGSTPAYRGVLELHGWNDLQPKLNDLSRSGEWDAMTDLITDDVLDAFSVVASEKDVANELKDRLGDVIDRFSLYPFDDTDSCGAKRILDALK